MNVDESDDNASVHGAIQKGLEQRGISPEEVQIKEFEDSDFDEDLWQASDDVHDGKKLDLGKTRAARAEEMGYVKKHGVYEHAPYLRMLSEDRSRAGRDEMDRYKQGR